MRPSAVGIRQRRLYFLNGTGSGSSWSGGSVPTGVTVHRSTLLGARSSWSMTVSPQIPHACCGDGASVFAAGGPRHWRACSPPMRTAGSPPLSLEATTLLRARGRTNNFHRPVTSNEPRADPAHAPRPIVPVWSVLFPSAAALVTDAGGIFSHAPIAVNTASPPWRRAAT